MTILSSTQSSPIFTQKTIKPIDSYPYAEDFQKAFEDGNSVAILDLIRRGANPNQPLKYTQKIARLQTIDYVAQTLLPKDWYEQAVKMAKSNDYQDFLNEIQDLEIKYRLEKIILRLQNEEVVSKEEVVDIANAIYVLQVFSIIEAQGEEPICMHPLALALDLHDFDLARELIRNGADLQEPLFLKEIGRNFSMDKSYESIIDFLVEQGFSKKELIDLIESYQECEC